MMRTDSEVDRAQRIRSLAERIFVEAVIAGTWIHEMIAINGAAHAVQLTVGWATAIVDGCAAIQPRNR